MERRAKFSHDPNNTAWTEGTDKYGQRMLQSQGWVPGASLGARGKPYTRPRGISHIRVSLKDDNLGLGARRGYDAPQQTGLDAFQGLLGRLNGKNDTALAAEQDTRDGLRRAHYMEQRWGTMRFISGGFLVGDQIEDARKAQNAVSASSDRLPTASVNHMEGTAKAIEAVQEHRVADASLDVGTAKRTEKSKRKKDRMQAEAEHVSEIKVKDTDAVSTSLLESTNNAGAIEAVRSTPTEERAQKRAGKAQRKLERRLRREAKSNPKEAVAKESEGQADEVPTTAAVERTLEPPLPRPSRQAIRQRYIQQKKMALADPRALNEVRP